MSLLMAFTDDGSLAVSQIASDGLVFEVRDVVYGTGGYDTGDPLVSLPLDPAATGLTAQVFREPVKETVIDTILANRGRETTYTSLRGDLLSAPAGIGEAGLIAVVTESGTSGRAEGEEIFLVQAHFARQALSLRSEHLPIKWPLDYGAFVPPEAGAFLFVAGQIPGTNGAAGTMTWDTPTPTVINVFTTQNNDFGYVAKYDGSSGTFTPLWVATASAPVSGGRAASTTVVSVTPLEDGGAIVAGTCFGTANSVLSLRDSDGVVRVSFTFTKVFGTRVGWYARIDEDGLWQWLRGVQMADGVNSVNSDISPSSDQGGCLLPNGNVLLPFGLNVTGTTSAVLRNPTATLLSFSISAATTFGFGAFVEIDVETGDMVTVKQVTRSTSSGVGVGSNTPILGPTATDTTVPYLTTRLGIQTAGVTSTSTFGPGEANQRAHALSEVNQCFAIGFRAGYVGTLSTTAQANNWTAVVRGSLVETSSNQRDVFMNAVDVHPDSTAVAWAGSFQPCNSAGGGTQFTQELTATSDNFTTPSTNLSTFITTGATYMPMYGAHDADGELLWFKVPGTDSESPSADATLQPVCGVSFDLEGRLYLAGRLQGGASVQQLDESLPSEVTFTNASDDTGTKGYLCRLEPDTGDVSWAQRVNWAATTSLQGQGVAPFSVGKLAWGVSAQTRATLSFDPEGSLGDTVTVDPPAGDTTGTNAALVVLSAASGAVLSGRVMPDSQTGTTLGVTIIVVRASES